MSDRDATTKKGKTALAIAVEKGHMDVASYLTARGVRTVAGAGIEGGCWSELKVAACVGNAVAVKRLLDAGADVDETDACGWTPLYVATKAGHARVAAMLIAKGADLRRSFARESGYLHIAAATKQPLVVRLLLSKGVDTSAENKYGKTPFYLGLRTGDLETVREFLVAGRLPDTSSVGWSPLHVAAQACSPGVVKLLLEHGADVNARIKNGETPLVTALSYGAGCPDVACMLIEGGADISLAKTGKYGGTPLSFAVNRRSKVLASLLLARGARHVAQEDEEGARWTPLHIAAYTGKLDALKELVARGMDPLAKDTYGRTPLQLAIRHDDVEAVKVMLDASPSALKPGENGRTLLHSAASWESVEVTKLLLSRDLSARAADSKRNTPLHLAALCGHSGVASLLVAAGADVNATDGAGGTPLHKAAFKGDVEVARLLLEQHAAVNPWNNLNDTPLRMAATFRHIDVVELLLRHGGYE